MTVRELIESLLEAEMDSEVTIIGNDSNNGGYEEFSDIDVMFRGKPFSGFPDGMEIHFQSEGFSFIDADNLKSMEEQIDELEAKVEELKEENNG